MLRVWLTVLGAAAIVCLVGLAFQLARGGSNDAPRGDRARDGVAQATFVGSESCAGCHRPEFDLWRASQHKRAMDHATEASVLGDFSNASFEYYGVHSRFFRTDGKYFVETDGPDGKLGTFEVKYTFGLDPLQQYLVEFPDGRLQALSIAWDSRPKQQGGQRWFHLYPNEEIRHDDALHWTKLNQNWNFMCAECHSTGVNKHYDAGRDRFSTTWAEISVGCEACHGRGSQHVAWARNRHGVANQGDDPAKGLLVRFDERRGISWPGDPSTGNAKRSQAAATLRKEVETCGLCHARRGTLSEDWVPGQWLSNTHMVAPLARGLYYADGQMRDEVYNYGSFKQSKMFAAGVTCSDCHEPHGAKLRFPGDNVCLQCHAPSTYTGAEHHHHEGASPPISCASCHMPTETYMLIDPRHDHSLRIPRPDQSVKFATPNACTNCHTQRSAQWAASAIEQWHLPSPKSFQNYAEALHAAWSDRADAAALLAAVAADPNAPAIARASALTQLGSHLSSAAIALAKNALFDPDPMVRIGALDLLEGLPLQQRWPFASRLLSDPVRGVRLRAISLLAAIPVAQLPASERGQFEHAAAEFIAAQQLNADRPEARTALGNFYAQRGAVAEAEYDGALRLSRQYAPAYVNLADLYRQTGRDSDAERMLREAAATVPNDAGVHHALGLTLVRLKRLDEALGELSRAADLAPDHARYSYVLGVALNSAGRQGEALAVLKDSLARHPNDRDTLAALISINRAAGELALALEYAEQLARIAPGDPNVALLIQSLQRQLGRPAQH